MQRSVIDAIGDTPLIRLKRASEETGCEILGKAEFMNPGQSVKDRAGLEQSSGLGIADDEEPRAVLHRLAGIHELGLAEDLAARLLGRALQPDQRRIADRVDH